ncbi:MAG: glycine/D-amino acid oxidase-like deaminating enzyme [Paracoccaceae bacterium]|jgi:glycine/D-amino acid oxidase-like deaminating enzyme
MTLDRPEPTLWRDTAAEALTTPPLTGDVFADLVVIGGGFAGCSAALTAAQAGASVRVLEARTLAHGGSGRNVGLVNAGLWMPPEDVELALGEAAGARLNAALAGGPALVFDLIERHAIACEPVRAGTLHCAHAPSGLGDLQRRHAQGVARGAPLTLLSAAEAKARTGARGLYGALHDARAGTIQPHAYCLGLARAAIAAGAVVHERSPATHIARDGDGWRVTTPGGTVRAGALLVLTNAYHMGADGVAAPQAIPVHYFQLATAPLPPALRAAVLPGAEGCWDTAQVMTSWRTDAAGRLILGAIGALDALAGPVHRAWAARKLARLYPALAGQGFAHAWHGRIAMTPDHAPKVLTLGPAGYAAFGWSGRGIAPGTVFGAALARAALGGGEAALPLAPVMAAPVRHGALRGMGYDAGACAVHLIAARARG